MELKTREQVKEHVQITFENSLVKVYQDNNVTTGDTLPHQHLRWVELVEKTTDLFMELLNQNKEIEEEG